MNREFNTNCSLPLTVVVPDEIEIEEPNYEEVVKSTLLIRNLWKDKSYNQRINEVMTSQNLKERMAQMILEADKKTKKVMLEEIDEN